MQSQIDQAHHHLGELASLSHQTQEAERKILDRAQARLKEVEQSIADTRKTALTGGGDDYMALIQERGQLHQVIALARHNLK
jgi:hypothetical protein